MMKKVTKKQLIEACKTILQEYKENRHEGSVGSCSLCKLFHENNCEGCPSSIFPGFVGCYARFCRANFSHCISKTEKLRLIKYWTLTIQWMKKQKADDLFKKKTYEILKQFDQQAYNKYQ